MHGDLTFTVPKLWNKKPEDIGIGQDLHVIKLNWKYIFFISTSFFECSFFGFFIRIYIFLRNFCEAQLIAHMHRMSWISIIVIIIVIIIIIIIIIIF